MLLQNPCPLGWPEVLTVAAAQAEGRQEETAGNRQSPGAAGGMRARLSEYVYAYVYVNIESLCVCIYIYIHVHI